MAIKPLEIAPVFEYLETIVRNQNYVTNKLRSALQMWGMLDVTEFVIFPSPDVTNVHNFTYTSNLGF
jgi:hypothetical protein